MRRVVMLTFVAMVLSTCSEPLEFPDWTIPVPEGTRVIEYAAVPMEDRTGKLIDVAEDLVIGNEDDPDGRGESGAMLPWVVSGRLSPPFVFP